MKTLGCPFTAYKIIICFQAAITTKLNYTNKHGMSIRKAGLEFYIPFTTLRDKIRMKYPEGAKSGKMPVFRSDEELRIVEWIASMARAGFPVPLKQLPICVAQFFKTIKRDMSFNNGIPGKNGFNYF